MDFNWKTGAEHKKLMAAKDDEIKTLQAQLDKKGDASDGDSTEKLMALFGDAANEDGFELEAAVNGLMTMGAKLEKNNTKLQGNFDKQTEELTTATGRLDDAAKVLGHESAEGVNLVEEIEAIEPQGKTNPKTGKKPVLDTEDEYAEFRCELDDELAAELAQQ